VICPLPPPRALKLREREVEPKRKIGNAISLKSESLAVKSRSSLKRGSPPMTMKLIITSSRDEIIINMDNRIVKEDARRKCIVITLPRAKMIRRMKFKS